MVVFDHRRTVNHLFAAYCYHPSLSDVTLVLQNGERIEAHSFILGSRSTVFREFLITNRVTRPLINIKIPHPIFYILLRYMYTGVLNIPEDVDILGVKEHASTYKLTGVVRALRYHATQEQRYFDLTNRLERDFKYFCRNSVLADVTLVLASANDARCPAHSFVLASQSLFFQHQLFPPGHTFQPLITLYIPLRTFNVLLIYMYTGYFEEDGSVNLEHVHYFAHLYNLQPLAYELSQVIERRAAEVARIRAREATRKENERKFEEEAEKSRRRKLEADKWKKCSLKLQEETKKGGPS